MTRAITALLLLASAPVLADDIDSGVRAKAPPDLSDQGIGASVGMAGGGRSTAGGLRIAGHYLYQLNDHDWFDGVAAFTFGSAASGCVRDRANDLMCDHGLTAGNAVEIGANVRRFMGGRDAFWPFVRLGVGVQLVRFGDDDISGIALPFHAGGGLRVSVSPGVAVTAEASLDLGIAGFTRELGLEPQLGGSVTAGAEFRL